MKAVVDLMRAGLIAPVSLIMSQEALTGAVEAFAARASGWLKVELEPAQ